MSGTPEHSLCVNSILLSNGEEKINVSNPNFECNKLSRFVFPKFDPKIDPSWHIDSRTVPEILLSIICNSLSILTEIELTHWNQLCQRDCLFLEKSKQGIYVSDFDIKNEHNLYKAKMSKIDYIEKLGEQNIKKSNKTDIRLNSHSLEMQSFYNPLMLIDRVKVQQLNINDLMSVYTKDPKKIVGQGRKK